ncbi:hypothetical protein GQX74_014900 [Glossina fuscipes]|nr:hypothetical protein GQX74_014900 [Glossina fuscipes]
MELAVVIKQPPIVIGNLDYFEVDEEEELSDWENSIESGDLDSTDDSGLEIDLELKYIRISYSVSN